MPGYLSVFDPDLRIRRSIEIPWTFILERRCRRRPAIYTGLDNRTDQHMQARDGYIHVARVHPAWLWRPWNIIGALLNSGADLWAEGGATKVENELQYEEWWRKENRRRHRKNDFRERALEMFDLLDRMGGRHRQERRRISNVFDAKAKKNAAQAKKAARRRPPGPVTLN